jgi:hypothetical protein
MAGLKVWGLGHSVSFSQEAAKSIDQGFGPRKDGEDAFDALAGLLSMIEVVDGRRSEGHGIDGPQRQWEGWILGQAPGGNAAAFERECHRQAILVRDSGTDEDLSACSDTTHWTVD